MTRTNAEMNLEQADDAVTLESIAGQLRDIKGQITRVSRTEDTGFSEAGKLLRPLAAARSTPSDAGTKNISGGSSGGGSFADLVRVGLTRRSDMGKAMVITPSTGVAMTPADVRTAVRSSIFIPSIVPGNGRMPGVLGCLGFRR